MELLKMIEVRLLIAHVLCFLIVLAVLRKFLWQPVFDTIDARRRKIDAEIKAVEDAKADVARLRADYELFLARVEEKARDRIKEAEQQGEFTAREIREKARDEAEKIVADSRREIAFEFAKTRESLRAEVVEMVITITEKMIQEKLSFESDRKIVEKLIAEIDRA